MKTKGKYWAIRIGDPKIHVPYFMLGEDRETPALFATKAKAEQKALRLRPGTPVEIVRVIVQ